MTTLWKAMQQDNIAMRQRLGSGDPTLTSLLGTFAPGEGTDTAFASTLVGASSAIRNPIKDKLARANSFSQIQVPGRPIRPRSPPSDVGSIPV